MDQKHNAVSVPPATIAVHGCRKNVRACNDTDTVKAIQETHVAGSIVDSHIIIECSVNGSGTNPQRHCK